MIDASHLSAFSRAPAASLTATATSAGDAAAGASAPLAETGEGSFGFAQWLAAWTPDTPPAVATAVSAPGSGAIAPTGTNTGSGAMLPGLPIRTDLPNVLSTPPSAAAGRHPAASPSEADAGPSVVSCLSPTSPTPLTSSAPAVMPWGRPVDLAATTAGPADAASVKVPDESADAVGAGPDGGVGDSASRDDPAPAAGAPGPEAALVAAWLWPSASPPVPATVIGAGSAGARNETVAAAASMLAPVSFGASPRDEAAHGTDPSQSLQDSATTAPDVAAVAASSSDAAGLAVAGWGAGPAPSLAPPAPSAAIEVAVATPVTAERFGDEVSMHLAQHVSRMTGETQEVVLHLHPAEMGPVSVGIELRGGVATVEFGAAQALTRQQLEQSLPALAQALRDEGLTLGQGLVHDRPASGGSGQRRRGENQFSIGAVSRASGRSEGGADEVSISLAPALTGRRSRIDLTA